MQGSGRQGGATRAMAWLGVIGVHACLFWLLTRQTSVVPAASDGPRLRLTFVEPARPAMTQPLARRPSSAPSAKAAPASSRPAAVLYSPATQTSAQTTITADQMREQAGEWAREQAGPTFTADPFASRRGQLPGGDGRGRFRMKEPLSPQKVLQAIGEMAGGRGYSQSPCPRIASNLPGLLTATSDQERELLDEELRRDREYCRP